MRFSLRNAAFALCLTVAGGAATTSPASAQACTPNMYGKYSGFITRLYVPSDVQQYGQCKDFGWSTQIQYGGRYGLPPSYWVYVAPNWYLWRNQHAAGTPGGPGAPPPAVQNCGDPSHGGRYQVLITRLYVPSDVSQYGGCKNYGWSTQTTYGGRVNLPPSYWVYSYPYWYLYRVQRW